MAAQIEAARDILKRKHHSIPDGVLYSNYFKRRLLETREVREHFARLTKPMSEREFGEFLETNEHCRLTKYAPFRITRRKHRYAEPTLEKRIRELKAQCFLYYQSVLSPESPIEVKPSSRYANQLGLFVRRDTVTVARGEHLFPHVLWGPLFPVSLEDDAELENKNHGSQSTIEKKPYVVGGALAFLNHHCDYSLGFSIDLKEPRPLPPPPARGRQKKRTRWNAFGPGVPVMHIKNNFQQLTLQPGDEITVDYEETFVEQPTFGDDCLCATCKPPIEENDTSDAEYTETTTTTRRKKNKKKK